MAKQINLNKHIWEGWLVKDFIERLQDEIHMIQSGQSWKPRMTTRSEVKAYCMDNQPYCKKHIPDVVEYFCQKYNVK